MFETSDSGSLEASFARSSAMTEVGPGGQVAHRAHLATAQRFELRLEAPAAGVWVVIGNGLSNQTFVDAPDGIIAIDTGESVEEMTAALTMLRQETDRPIAAVMYTHFHYVNGTTAIDADAHIDGYDVWGHERIIANRLRMSSEAGTTMRRGLAFQFGTTLPLDGPDGLVSGGLGPWLRNPAHAPFTPGFVEPTQTIADATTATIAGMQVHMTLAPSDADDSITIWFPEIGLAVHNILWPALFNVFAIRGEEYRDPRVLLRGLDHLHGLGAHTLAGTHGPPLAGAELISAEITRARDAIQFLWDQTVRGLNLDLTEGELIEFVQLPACYEQSYFTQQLYGLAEHHTRQIHTGLRGWFDGYEADLFPLPTSERARRLIDGFGGRTAVAAQSLAALESDDVRWALELATWLVRSELNAAGRADGGTADERALLARVLRTIAQRTTSANIRNWCLTRARELDGLTDHSRLRRPRFSIGEVLSAEPATFVNVLRVLLVPERTVGFDGQLAWVFDDGSRCGLHVRHCVAVPTDGSNADDVIELTQPTWATVLAGTTTFDIAVAAGHVLISGDSERVRRFLRCFDHPPLHDIRSASDARLGTA